MASVGNEQEMAGYRLLGPGDVQVIARVARVASSRFIGIDHAQTVSLTLSRVARILARVGDEKAGEILASAGYLYKVTERQARKVARKLAGAGGLRGKEGGADMERVEGSPNYSPFTGEPVRLQNAAGKVGQTHEPMAVGWEFQNPADISDSVLERVMSADIPPEDKAICAVTLANVDLVAPKTRPSFGSVYVPFQEIEATLARVGIRADSHKVRTVLTRTLRALAADEIASMLARQACGQRWAERAESKENTLASL